MARPHITDPMYDAERTSDIKFKRNEKVLPEDIKEFIKELIIRGVDGAKEFEFGRTSRGARAVLYVVNRKDTQDLINSVSDMENFGLLRTVVARFYGPQDGPGGRRYGVLVRLPKRLVNFRGEYIE